jgi:ubiquinone/menaquinone biosynthesis C-methylase UbiE
VTDTNRTEDNPGSERPETVVYASGVGGYRDVDTYDDVRYRGAANAYKHRVMAAALRSLIGSCAGMRILDVGCGTGRGLLDTGIEAATAVGLDASYDMLRTASRKDHVNARRFVCGYAQALPFASASFDAVISLNFLHLFSVATQQAMVAEMKRVVRPGGALVLEFDNALQGGAIGALKRWCGRECGNFPREIRRVIGDGMRVRRVRGAVFPIVWRLFYRWPAFGETVERLAYVAPFSRLAHRVYYKLTKDGR